MYSGSKYRQNSLRNGSETETDGLMAEFLNFPMAKRQVLKDSYARMIKNPMSCNGLNIFLRMFRDQPHYKDIFPQFKYVHDAHMMGSNELRRHGQLYMDTVKDIMNSLDDDVMLERQLKKVAVSHKKHGVTKGHLDNMVEAVIEALESEGKVSDEEKDAWRLIFKSIGNMIEHYKGNA